MWQHSNVVSFKGWNENVREFEDDFQSTEALYEDVS